MVNTAKKQVDMGKERPRHWITTSVLIVNNDRSTKDLLCMLLETKGYRVKAASNGKEALGSIDRDNDSMIVTDLEMPMMNGNRLLETVKTGHRDHKVIILSSEVADRQYFLRRGALETIEKPIDLDSFLGRLRRLIRERRKTRRFQVKKQGAYNGIACTLKDKKGTGCYPGTIIDISVDGALVQVPQKVEDLEELDLEFSLSDRQKAVGSISGQVIRILKGPGSSYQVAIYFDSDRDPGFLDTLEPYIQLKADDDYL